MKLVSLLLLVLCTQAQALTFSAARVPPPSFSVSRAAAAPVVPHVTEVEPSPVPVARTAPTRPSAYTAPISPTYVHTVVTTEYPWYTLWLGPGHEVRREEPCDPDKDKDCREKDHD